nr:SDR family NAD(P)-dependent oxidoreductase [Agreia bicolorata]
MNITGNTIFIPGATSGLGLGLALRFQAAGNHVIVGGRRTELLDRIATEHPGIDAVQIDTADPSSIEKATQQVVAEHPELDTVILMAGIMEFEDLHTADFLETAERTIATNLLGPIRLIAALVPHLSSRPSATIMTVSSGLAFVPLPATPTYSATKAAIHSFSQSLRVQLADTSIQVLELAPPAVATTLLGQENDPHAMPVDEFLDETMSILEANPDATEILVDRVRFLRFAEAEAVSTTFSPCSAVVFDRGEWVRERLADSETGTRCSGGGEEERREPEEDLGRRGQHIQAEQHSCHREQQRAERIADHERPRRSSLITRRALPVLSTETTR